MKNFSELELAKHFEQELNYCGVIDLMHCNALQSQANLINLQNTGGHVVLLGLKNTKVKYLPVADFSGEDVLVDGKEYTLEQIYEFNKKNLLEFNPELFPKAFLDELNGETYSYELNFDYPNYDKTKLKY